MITYSNISELKKPYNIKAIAIWDQIVSYANLITKQLAKDIKVVK
jgi:hypothetical protein